MASLPNDAIVKSVLSEAALIKSGESGRGGDFALDDQLFRTVALQLQALNLCPGQWGMGRRFEVLEGAVGRDSGAIGATDGPDASRSTDVWC